MQTIDTRGLSCPQPVLLVLECLKGQNPEVLTVLVDNEASEENVSRAAVNRGYVVQAEPAESMEAGITKLTLTRS